MVKNQGNIVKKYQCLSHQRLAASHHCWAIPPAIVEHSSAEFWTPPAAPPILTSWPGIWSRHNTSEDRNPNLFSQYMSSLYLLVEPVGPPAGRTCGRLCQEQLFQAGREEGLPNHELVTKRTKEPPQVISLLSELSRNLR